MILKEKKKISVKFVINKKIIFQFFFFEFPKMVGKGQGR